MSGFVAVPNDALAVCRDDAEARAVFDLSRMADAHRWGPFEAPEDLLCLRWGMGNRRVRGLLDRLEAAGCLQVIAGERRSQARKLILVCPTGAQQDQQQGRSKDAARTQQGTVAIPSTCDGSAARTQQGRSKDAARTTALPREEECCSSRPIQTPDSRLGQNTPPSPSPGEAVSVPDPVQPDPVPVPQPEQVPLLATPPSPPKRRGRTAPRADWGPDGDAVWAAYRVHRPRRDPVCPEGYRDCIRSALGRHALGDVLLVVAWVFLAPHPRAEFLRTEQDGIQTLMVEAKFQERLDWAREWEAAGRPNQRASPDPWAKPRRNEGMTRDWFRPQATDAEEPYTIDVPPGGAAPETPW